MITITSTVGDAKIMTTNNRGHSPEELAELAMGKIINIRGDVPEPIRAQVEAYTDRLREILLFYLRKAQSEERATIVAMLDRYGHSDITKHLRG